MPLANERKCAKSIQTFGDLFMTKAKAKIAKAKIYLAGALFTQAEREFNVKLRDVLMCNKFDVFLPQEDSEVVKDREMWQHEIFEKNEKAIQDADIVVAVIDGSDIDSGTAWEIGYAYGIGKPIIGLRTDFRTMGIEGIVNLMIEQSIPITKTIPELLNHLNRNFELLNNLNRNLYK